MSEPPREGALPKRRPGTRKHLGPVEGSPVTSHPNLDALTEEQRALRLAALREFKAKKVRAFVEKQVEHMRVDRTQAEGIRFLFDEHGRPPPNAPLEDIVAERRSIDYQIRWFEAMLSELRQRHERLTQLENVAFDALEDEAVED